MKNKLLILLGILIFFQFGFSLDCLYRGYQKENNKVYYKYHKEKIEVEEADYNTFEVIFSEPAMHFSLLAKDKNNLYYQGKKLEGIDSDSFIMIKEIKPPVMAPWGYGCASSEYIIEDKGKKYELKEQF